MKRFAEIICCGLFCFLSGCQTQSIRPAIVPVVENNIAPSHSLGVIGAVEPVYILPMKTPFSSFS